MSVLEPVAAPHTLPYRRVASVRAEQAARVEVGTGWFFGDFLVVTAAYVLGGVSDPLITVWPGRSEQQDSFFGVWTTRRFRIGTAGDYAGIFLPQPVGLSVGTFGIANLDLPLNSASVEVAGYTSADLGTRQWHAQGPVIASSSAAFEYDITTLPGQSGSPLWFVGDPDHLAGMHDASNHGIRFSENIIRELLEWRSLPTN
jgi:V8-like Glu-specific endopeptidase